MEKIIYISVILVFCFIVYKKQIFPLLSKRKQKDTPAKSSDSTGSVDPVKDEAPALLPSGVVDSSGFTSGGVLTKYQILAFDYTYDGLTPFEFADRVQSRLSVSLSQIAELGCPYRVDFITLGTALLVLISYRVVQPVIPRVDNV
jgi:hypothetical protein